MESTRLAGDVCCHGNCLTADAMNFLGNRIDLRGSTCCQNQMATLAGESQRCSPTNASPSTCDYCDFSV